MTELFTEFDEKPFTKLVYAERIYADFHKLLRFSLLTALIPLNRERIDAQRPLKMSNSRMLSDALIFRKHQENPAV